MSTMNIVTIGIDLGKNTFHVVGSMLWEQSTYARSDREISWSSY
jgi:hypothetical protein